MCILVTAGYISEIPSSFWLTDKAYPSLITSYSSVLMAFKLMVKNSMFLARTTLPELWYDDLIELHWDNGFITSNFDDHCSLIESKCHEVWTIFGDIHWPYTFFGFICIWYPYCNWGLSPIYMFANARIWWLHPQQLRWLELSDTWNDDW